MEFPQCGRDEAGRPADGNVGIEFEAQTLQEGNEEADERAKRGNVIKKVLKRGLAHAYRATPLHTRTCIGGFICNTYQLLSMVHAEINDSRVLSVIRAGQMRCGRGCSSRP